MRTITCLFTLLLGLTACNQQPPKNNNAYPGNLYTYTESTKTRWSSPENITAEKGKGASANHGAKGHPYDSINSGESRVLLDVQGQGIVNRIWITINDRSPEMLRSLKLEMYWDNEKKPAVTAPLGDFFGVGLGRMATFENALFASPEGRSFLCYIPMPFRKAAKIVVTNESGKMLSHIFFDVNFQFLEEWDEQFMYFHAYWHRDTATTVGKDFELMPQVTGKGRFLGVNVGVNANPAYNNTWWGEGEVKMYMDGDKDLPTLAGTGTEDYIGTAWSQGWFCNQYSGCLVDDAPNKQWAFYRFHIPDPVFFSQDCRVTLQQIGGAFKKDVWPIQRDRKAKLIPVTIGGPYAKSNLLFNKDSVVSLNDPSLPEGWTNFYRSDDVSATAYFYLATPSNNLPPLQPSAVRTTQLRSKSD